MAWSPPARQRRSWLAAQAGDYATPISHHIRDGAGALAPVDWYALREGRMVGVVEVKSRGHRRADHRTVFLNVRKWMWLIRYSMGLGVRALFVVRFSDALCWVPLDEVDARNHKIGGCARRVKSRSDVEPVIEVPVEMMREIV